MKIKDVLDEGIFSRKPAANNAESAVTHWVNKWNNQISKNDTGDVSAKLHNYVSSIVANKIHTIPMPGPSTDPAEYIANWVYKYYNSPGTQTNTASVPTTLSTQQAQNNPVTDPSTQQAQNNPVTDIKQTVPAGFQFRFPNPEPNANNNIIIRQDGYYVDRIPKSLVGRVKKVNGLYPVQRQENIDKFNKYYDLQADRGLVKEEPIHAL
jgi:hypothetical protein